MGAEHHSSSFSIIGFGCLSSHQNLSSLVFRFLLLCNWSWLLLFGKWSGKLFHINIKANSTSVFVELTCFFFRVANLSLTVLIPDWIDDRFIFVFEWRWLTRWVFFYLEGRLVLQSWVEGYHVGLVQWRGSVKVGAAESAWNVLLLSLKNIPLLFFLLILFIFLKSLLLRLPRCFLEFVPANLLLRNGIDNNLFILLLWTRGSPLILFEFFTHFFVRLFPLLIFRALFIQISQHFIKFLHFVSYISHIFLL